MQKIQVSKSSEIHVQKKEYNGQMKLDIRVFVTTDKYTGYTKKGINVPVEMGQQVVDAIVTELKQ